MTRRGNQGRACCVFNMPLCYPLTDTSCTAFGFLLELYDAFKLKLKSLRRSYSSDRIAIALKSIIDEGYSCLIEGGGRNGDFYVQYVSLFMRWKGAECKIAR